MTNRWTLPVLGAVALAVAAALLVHSDEPDPKKPEKAPQPPDAVADAQSPRPAKADRPELRLSKHDQSAAFSPDDAPASSEALPGQPEQGKFLGFDFARDPLGAKKPMQTPEDIMKQDIADKPKVMAQQQKLLESRYDLKPKLDNDATMSRGKRLCVGPTARLPGDVTFEALAKVGADEIRTKDAFPYKALPHPKHTPGGMVFPKVQTEMFPRLERFDVDYDLPEAFLPEFPPAIFLQNRPELGDVSRGEVVSINNYYRLFKGILTPVELDGLRLLATPAPQEEFNPTDDRKTVNASLGVTCLDCHVNGHTTGQIELNPDDRPQQRRFRLDTPSMRGTYNQQIFGSKRAIRSLKDFAEFEQRTAYFNGDSIHAEKKGKVEFTPEQAAHMERAQSMFDFPPAPKLDLNGRLIADKATDAEKAGEKLFFGKAQCAGCHPPPFFLDNQMHDLHLERFLAREPGDGPIKSFTLRGIKDSPPYLHDGRCLTLEDAVEFFNLVQGLNLTKEEKANLVAYLRQL